MIWECDIKSGDYLCGDQNRGAGVYLDGDSWYGNVCHPYAPLIVGYGPFDSPEAAKIVLEKELEELDKKYQE